MRKFAVLAVMSVAFNILNTFTSNAADTDVIYVQIERISVSPFALDLQSGLNTSKIVVDFKSEGKFGNGEENTLGFSCINITKPFQGDSVSGELIQTGQGEYRKTCLYTAAPNHPSEIIQLTFFVPQVRSCFIAASSNKVAPINSIDSFGVTTKKYVELSRQLTPSCMWSIPLAVNPPTNFQLPAKSKDGTTEIFVSQKIDSKPKVIINTKKRSFSIICPKPNSSFSNVTYSGYALANDIAFGLSVSSLSNDIPYGTKTFLGKKVTIYCAVIANFKTNFNSSVGYIETDPVTIQLPSK